MNRHGIEHAFPIVATALGRRFGVTVRFGGDTAATNGQVINLPALDLASSAREAAWGFLVHEASHVRFTDYDQWARVQSSALRAAFANAAEDIRIEQAMAREYPGTKRMLDEALEHVVAQGGMQPPKANDTLAQVVFGYVLACMRYRHLDQHQLADITAAAGQEIDNRLSAGVRTRLDVLIDQAGKLASTKEAIDLADRLIQTLEEAEQEARDRANQGDAQQSASDSSQAQAGAGDTRDAGDDGDATRGDASDGDGGQPSQASGSDGDAGTQQGADAASPSAADGQQAGSDAGQHDQALADALRSVIEAGDDEMGDNLGEQLAAELNQAHRRDVTSTATAPIVPMPTKTRGEHNAGAPTEALEASRRLQARLRGLIEASQRRRPMTSRRGKRVDSKRVSRIGVGDPRVLRREADKVAPNAAVHLVVDQSGSMSRADPENLAMGAALALSAALYEIRGVSPAASAFSTGGCARILEHGESPRHRCGRFFKNASGNTPMAEAMMAALTSLVAQRHERKLLIVVTDGAPNGDTGDAGVREIVRRCAISGLEVLGIGIGVDLSHLFDRWTSIQEVGQLRERLFDLTHRHLVPAA